MAAKLAKFKSVPVEYQNFKSLDEENAALLADNKIAELSEIDNEILTEMFKDFNFEEFGELTGYSDDEYKELTSMLEEPEEVADPDTIIEPPKVAFTQPGDIWELGKHRLICGDTRVTEIYSELLQGESADLVLTDPPYNVDYTGKTKDALKIKNDKKEDKEFYNFLLACFTPLVLNLKQGGSFYCWHADSERVNFQTALEAAGVLVKQNIVWVKNTMVLGRQDYQWKHEPCLYGWREGAAHYFIDVAITNSARNKRNRFDVQKVLSNRIKYIKKVKEVIYNNSFAIPLHKGIKILDGSSKKERLIIVPSYMYEQIVQHAVVQVLQPIIMRGMYVFSCGSVPNRGIHYGKRYIEKFIREHNDASNIDLLMRKFKRVIKDDKMLSIIDTILKSNKAECDGKIIDMGLPIGFYSSQWFANFFLQDFDHFVKEKLHIKCFVRYVDDIVIFGSSKKQLHKDFLEIKKFLEAEKLTIKENWQIFKFDYINKKKGNESDVRLILWGLNSIEIKQHCAAAFC